MTLNHAHRSAQVHPRYYRVEPDPRYTCPPMSAHELAAALRADRALRGVAVFLAVIAAIASGGLR